MHFHSTEGDSKSCVPTQAAIDQQKQVQSSQDIWNRIIKQQLQSQSNSDVRYEHTCTCTSMHTPACIHVHVYVHVA